MGLYVEVAMSGGLEVGTGDDGWCQLIHRQLEQQEPAVALYT